MFIRHNVSSLHNIDGLIFIIERLINHLELISNLNLVSTSLSNLLIHELSDFLILKLSNFLMVHKRWLMRLRVVQRFLLLVVVIR